MPPRKHLLFTLALALSGLVGTACAQPAVRHTPGPGGLEAWERNHPEASRDLGFWVKEHPKAARQFFAWDARHPERSHLFVTWAITHPREGIKAFAIEHPNWEYFDDIALNHIPAANSFMAWCRRHPEAAEKLMNHPGGLDWAGRHLYMGFWTMEEAGR